jgi:pimeloyl-ACP methyl ester carboxylesterase
MSSKILPACKPFTLITGLLLLIDLSFTNPLKADPIEEYSVEIIGGVKQAILIRGENNNNPVMLRFHGGPGYPYFPYLPKNGPLKDLEKHFTMVYWEQRGTGASYSSKIKKSSMNVDRFVEDAHEVIQFVKNKLQVENVYIWGHSWGSSIGILLAKKYPEDIIAYIGTGQSVFPLKNERACYNYAIEKVLKEDNPKGLRELYKIDTSQYDLKDALTVRKWIYSYGGVVLANGDERPYVDEKIIKKIWRTPQYNFRNKINIIFHPYYSTRQLWEDMRKINLFKQLPDIEIPVYFMLGRHDRIVSSELAAEYFHYLKATAGKQLIWFDHSAHRPHKEEPDKFFHILTKKVLGETYDSPNRVDTPVAGK